VAASGSATTRPARSGTARSAPLVADPLLGELGDHGGVTETLVPASGSPARSLGTGCPATDQLGNPRADPCTAGAVEVP
jgi:hypothetical protein